MASIETLRRLIAKRRIKLDSMLTKSGGTVTDKIIRFSQRLDKNIVEYVKLRYRIEKLR